MCGKNWKLKLKLLIIFLLIPAMAVLNTKYKNNHLQIVCAESKDIIYEYDSSGRVISVIYPDGSNITYQYDNNGNIKDTDVKIISKHTVENDDENTEKSGKEEKNTEAEDSTEIKNSTEIENNVNTEKSTEQENGIIPRNNNDTTENIDNNMVSNSNSISDKKTSDISQNNKSEANSNSLKNYKLFKNSKPRIVSVKRKGKKKIILYVKPAKKEKGKLTVGYQLRYADNKKFKRSKSISFKANLQKKKTRKQWRVKNKTYYVKIRAYTKNNSGKKIYSKYTKWVVVKKK